MQIIVAAAAVVMIVWPSNLLLGLSLGLFQQYSYWSLCPHRSFPPCGPLYSVTRVLFLKCLLHIIHFIQNLLMAPHCIFIH